MNTAPLARSFDPDGPNPRRADQLRPIQITRHYTNCAEGSVLVEYGQTRVLCNATVCRGTRDFLKGTGQGWLTAEYSMLPQATSSRCPREVTRGQISGRTHEIQRLIGRALRSAVHLDQLGEYTIWVDCDVLQADGGTRTASVTGGFIAVCDALKRSPFTAPSAQKLIQHAIAAVSVALIDGKPVLDPDYSEDARCQSDMNFIMTQDLRLVEIQGAAERGTFSPEQLNQALELAQQGITELLALQKQALL